ncbi:MAG: hypothetical protein AAB355_01710 [Patescibacteria group bacterium]
MVHKLIHLFDRFEDRVRNVLSHYPIIYALVSGVGIVLFWRGVWHTADMFPFMTGPVSLIISLVILLSAGLFVSFFVGENIIIAGIRRQKKLVEKAETEIETEKEELDDIREEIRLMREDVRELKGIIGGNNKKI